MDYNQLLEDLKNYESVRIECKASLKEDEIGRSIAAFSTKKGGKIYLGVSNKRELVGIRWGDKFNDRISEIARTCVPSGCISINTIKYDKENVIGCITVAKGDGRVYTYKKVPYERREGINHPLTPDEIVDIEKRAKRLSFDEQQGRSKERPALISDVDVNKILSYLKLIKGTVKEDFDLKQFLINNEFAINGTGKVRNAAILLFGKNVEQFIPQNKVSISVFPDENVTDNFYKVEIAGDLIDIVKRTFIEIEKNITVFSFLKGLQRIDIPEYPPEVIREGIINAIAHRDYSTETTEIFIKIFSNRIEIINPGGFPFAGYSWDEVERSGLSLRRNPKIATFLEKAHYMEQEGHGIRRIKEKTKSHGLKEPAIEVTHNTFKITFFGTGQEKKRIFDSPFKKVIDVGALTERQIKGLKRIEEVGSMSRQEYQDYFGGLNLKMAQRDLVDLVKKDKLITKGKGPNLRYAIKK